jgi:microcystin-dependent protein
MTTPYIGQLQLFGFNFAPVGWALCQGQLLSVSQYSALFSILGTNFGGNGQTTFGFA